MVVGSGWWVVFGVVGSVGGGGGAWCVVHGDKSVVAGDDLFLYMYIYIYMYICIHIHTCIYKCICSSIFSHMYLYFFTS